MVSLSCLGPHSFRASPRGLSHRVVELLTWRLGAPTMSASRQGEEAFSLLRPGPEGVPMSLLPYSIGQAVTEPVLGGVTKNLGPSLTCQSGDKNTYA